VMRDNDFGVSFSLGVYGHQRGIFRIMKMYCCMIDA
jgi:hypothetical protein